MPSLLPNRPYDADSDLALALSGGRFRATLFHLGVIRLLRAVNLLPRVRHIAAVSGGSIVAAHLCLHWSRYCGSLNEFTAVSRELIAFCQRDIRGRIGRRIPLLLACRLLPLPRNFAVQTTTDLLAKYLRSFFGDYSLADIKRLQPEAPRLSIVATNLTFPGLSIFEDGRVQVINLQGIGGLQKIATHAGAIVPLHLAVGASAAYPAFFPPAIISHRDLRLPESYGTQSHTDGGVIDNQGLTALFEQESEPANLLVSDATEATVVARPGTRFGIIGTGLRATQIMMSRIRSYREEELSTKRPGSTVFIRISSTTNCEGAAHLAVQTQIPDIRTDLDRFSNLEVAEISRHGFWLARENIPARDYDSEFEPQRGSGDFPSKTADLLRKGFGLRLRLLSWRDPITAVYAFSLILLIGILLPHLRTVAHHIGAMIEYSQVADLLDQKIPDIPKDPPIAIESVNYTAQRPSNSGFEVLAEHRIWDLRTLHLADNKSHVSGSGFMTRLTELRRLTDEARVYSYFLKQAAR